MCAEKKQGAPCPWPHLAVAEGPQQAGVRDGNGIVGGEEARDAADDEKALGAHADGKVDGVQLVAAGGTGKGRGQE